MGSRATIPDRPAALLFGLGLLAGCPPHDATIEVSSGGANTLIQACRSCGREGIIDPTCACSLGDRPPPDILHHTVQARLFLITPTDRVVRDSSKCMSLGPCADGGKPDNCIAENLNQQLDGAIARGLGFDALKNPDDVQLVLAFYEPASGAAESCARANLVACAGLEPPLGGGNFDIQCASCQGGTRNAPGPDNGPCPKPRGMACFLNDCDAILMQNGF